MEVGGELSLGYFTCSERAHTILSVEDLVAPIASLDILGDKNSCPWQKLLKTVWKGIATVCHKNVSIVFFWVYFNVLWEHFYNSFMLIKTFFTNRMQSIPECTKSCIQCPCAFVLLPAVPSSFCELIFQIKYKFGYCGNCILKVELVLFLPH
jgi:hypothetical protein